MGLKKPGKNEPVPIIKKYEIIKGGGGEDESNWLVSYADMMTLLCGFFIMMFSMATLDAPKYDSFKEAMAKQFGGEYTSPTKELARFATNVIQELGIDKEAVVTSDPFGVSVTFESTVFFDTLSADVTQKGMGILQKLIAAVAKRQTENGKVYRIVVEGHTDGRPIMSGSFPSNWELSGSRAARVVRLFLDQGYRPDRLTAIGYADTRPVLPERRADGTWDEAALGKNRRVVLRVLEPNVDAIPFPAGAAAPAGGAGTAGAASSTGAASATPGSAPVAAVSTQAVAAPATTATATTSAPSQSSPTASH